MTMQAELALHELDLNSFRSLEEKEAYLGDVRNRMSAIVKAANGLPLGDELKAEFSALEEREEQILARIDEQKYLLARVERFSQDPDRTESGADEVDDVVEETARSFRRPGQSSRTGTSFGRRADSRRMPSNIFDLGAYRVLAPRDAEFAQAIQDGAKKAIEISDFYGKDVDQDGVKTDLMQLMGTVDDPVRLSEHILTTGSPAYLRGFANRVAGRPLNGVDEMRAMELGVDSAGGFAVPFQLDPTLIRTSDGAINSVRGLARQERITGIKWQGITASGVVVRRGAEKSVAVPSEPTLARPELGTVKVDAFVPFTIELGLAWSSILTQIAPLLQDGKDEEEADSFIHGDGTGEEPFGLLGTMPDSSRISVGADFGPEDLYGVDGTDANALAPRWRARAAFLGSKGIYNTIRQFGDGQDGANLWARLAEGTPDRLLNYRTEEQSTMAAAPDDGEDILVLGDFNQFLIVDRIGMTVEVIQHLTQQAVAGQGFGIPVGMRGIYAHWHNNARILVPNAFRVLHVGAVGSGS